MIVFDRHQVTPFIKFWPSLVCHFMMAKYIILELGVEKHLRAKYFILFRKKLYYRLIIF